MLQYLDDDDIAYVQKYTKTLAGRIGQIKKLEASLKQVVATPTAAALSKASQEAGDCSSMSSISIEDECTFRSWLEGKATQARRRLQREFAVTLRELGDNEGLTLEQVAAEPAEYRWGHFTLLPDFLAGKCQIHYARLPVLECETEPEVVVASLKDAENSLNSPGFVAEEFFHKLRKAYLHSLEGKPVGTRVELVDLCLLMASVMGQAKFASNPLKPFTVSYSMVQFAWDIGRMRRALGLANQGWRFNFGTATMGQTRNKKRVLYLEDGRRGQYYASICCVKMENE